MNTLKPSHHPQNSSLKISKILSHPIMNILENKTWKSCSVEHFVAHMHEQEQEKIKEIRRQEKIKIIQENLGIKSEKEAKNRPDSHFLDKSIWEEISSKNLKNIISFMALQNLACAFSCCWDSTSPERVQEIANIYNGNFGEKFLHFHLYQESGWTEADWKKEYENDIEEGLQYFQVFLKDIPQNNNEQQKILQEFQKLYRIAQSK